MEFGGPSREQKDIRRSAHQSSRCSIFRVPESKRRQNEHAYTPRVVSIGPFHHGREDLKAMEVQKMYYVKDFLHRPNVSLKSCIKVVSDKEAELRSCYFPSIEFSSEEFIEIILVDAIFIIEVLVRYNKYLLDENDDSIFGTLRRLEYVWLDMELLENQLPFFILELLFDLNKEMMSSDFEGLSITDLSCNFWKNRLGFVETEDSHLTSPEVEHFVDLINKLHQPLGPQTLRGNFTREHTPNIRDLVMAGVRFKVCSGRRLDIRFDSCNRILELPKLVLNDRTKVRFRNMTACNRYISDYILMMACLLKTPEDVDFLVHHGIVVNFAGNSRHGLTFIKQLARGTVVNFINFSFASLFDDLEKYYETNRHKWKTTWFRWKESLRQPYFITPRAIAIVFVVVLTALNFIRAVCCVLSPH